jgi:ribosomal protein L23
MLQPYITEKSAMNIAKNTYVFLVDAMANKKTVAAELKAHFDVTPTSVRIINVPAKKVRFRQKPGTQAKRRKAYVQLPPKQKIAGFESLTENKDSKTKNDKTEKETS